jgi:CubicO group peptidase (beta-lactamase class C family)
MDDGHSRAWVPVLRAGILVGALGGATPALTAQTVPEVVTAAAEARAFAGVVLVRYRDGAETFVSVGDAVREFAVPHGRDTRFKWHSLSKSVTSVAAHAAAASGALDLGASVCRYLPSCPPGGAEVQVKHLLNHSSGLPELEAAFLEHWSGDAAATFRAIVASGAELRPLAPAGREFRYSNGGYALLGLILSASTRRPIPTVLRDLVFTPAGMHDALLEQAPDAEVSPWYRGAVIVPRLASGYNGTPTELRRAHSMMYAVAGAGGVIGTADDLVCLARALFRGDLLATDARARMLTADSAVSATYADGWVQGSQAGQLWHGHTGGNNGFVSSLQHYPTLGMTVAVLGNLGFTDLRRLRDDVADAAVRTALALAHDASGAAPRSDVNRRTGGHTC